MRRRRWFATLATMFLALLAVEGCKRATPEAPPPEVPSLPPLEVTDEGAKAGTYIFTYARADGTFVSTDKLDEIPAPQRRLVRVVDPSRPANQRQDTTRVYVVDLARVASGGKAAARVLSREAFESGALALLPAGASSPRGGGPTEGLEPGGAAADAGAGPALEPGQTPLVTVYGTSWCGACRAARAYLSSRKIPFADKDVEHDPAAARELEEKGARLGVPTNRVPILDVRGRLLVGFDRERLESLLGEAI